MDEIIVEVHHNGGWHQAAINSVAALPETMQCQGVDEIIIERLAKRIADLVLSLKDV